MDLESEHPPDEELRQCEKECPERGLCALFPERRDGRTDKPPGYCRNREVLKAIRTDMRKERGGPKTAP